MRINTVSAPVWQKKGSPAWVTSTAPSLLHRRSAATARRFAVPAPASGQLWFPPVDNRLNGIGNKDNFVVNGDRRTQQDTRIGLNIRRVKRQYKTEWRLFTFGTHCFFVQSLSTVRQPATHQKP